jgi:hypothetical protein
MNDMENDAAQRNEAIDSGVLYGLLNGARGIGYVSGSRRGVRCLWAAWAMERLTARSLSLLGCLWLSAAGA